MIYTWCSFGRIFANMGFDYCGLFLLLFTAVNYASESDQIDDANVRRQFIDIVKNAKFVAVLFSEPCCTCTECVEAEALLAAMNEQLLQQYQVVTVKLFAQEDIAKSYGVTQRPTLVFFRSERPVIYDGKFEPEELTDWLSNSQEPNVKQLDDSTFEHLTQAATGATTGDWLVTFFNSQCKYQKSLHAVLDSVALRLKGHGNVALVNTDDSIELKERFSISKCPTTIFFRLGKMYLYELPSFTPVSLRSFAEGFYKNAKSSPVPKIPSPFDKLVDQCVQYLKINSWVPLVGLLMTIVIVTVALLSRRQKATKTE